MNTVSKRLSVMHITLLTIAFVLWGERIFHDFIQNLTALFQLCYVIKQASGELYNVSGTCLQDKGATLSI